MPYSPLDRSLIAQIRQLRLDARRLVAIANHLRLEANQMAKELRSRAQAESTRKNFYSTNTKYGQIPYTPTEEKDLFTEMDKDLIL